MSRCLYGRASSPYGICQGMVSVDNFIHVINSKVFQQEKECVLALNSLNLRILTLLLVSILECRKYLQSLSLGLGSGLVTWCYLCISSLLQSTLIM